MTAAPLVAVTTSSNNQRGVKAHYLREIYTQALSAVGIIPFLVPSTLSMNSLRELYTRVDGVLLTGGGDMHPAYSGITDSDSRAALVIEVDEPRDQTEVNLVRWAYQDDKPLLGICRGHQVLNVALGGTLIMDIPTLIGQTVTHKVADWHGRRGEFLHTVDVCPNTRLSEIIGAGSLPVNSIHHQAVECAADSLHVTAYAPDGVIEGLEVPGARFFVGVQWHPEEIFMTSPPMLALFQAFADVMQ